jgi:hypothetical protein
MHIDELLYQIKETSKHDNKWHNQGNK